MQLYLAVEIQYSGIYKKIINDVMHYMHLFTFWCWFQRFSLCKCHQQRIPSTLINSQIILLLSDMSSLNFVYEYLLHGWWYFWTFEILDVLYITKRYSKLIKPFVTVSGRISTYTFPPPSLWVCAPVVESCVVSYKICMHIQYIVSH